MEIVIATDKHIKYAQMISQTIDRSADQRGTGIAKRTPEYIETKIKNGNAVIALEWRKICRVLLYRNLWG